MSRVLLEYVAREHKETYKGSKEGFPIVGLEHLDPQNINLTRWSEQENTFTKMFRKGNMLFGRRRAYLKKAAVAPFDGICSGDITVIEAIPERVIPELLPFIIQNDSLFDFAVQKSAGSLSPRVKWEHLKNYEFELPNMDKQKQLAELLWSMNETMESYRELILATDELVKSQFVEWFGTWKDTKYTVQTLEELCELIKDGTHKTPTYTDDKEKGFLFLSSKDVTSKYVDWSNPMYITAKLHEELRKRVSPRRGDILLAKNGTTGIAAIVDRDEIFDIYVSLALLRFHPEHNINFMWSAINMPETKLQFDGGLKGIGVPNLHLKEIKKTKIVVPPIELQEQFASFVQQTDQSKSQLQQALSELMATYKRILAENLG